ncbi:MAG: hypothetical protein Q7S87_09970 [Agitococcus sp.]|nr:hypothetical protein [Agitococcus sp.]
MKSVMKFLKELSETEGSVSVTKGVVVFENGQSFDLKKAVPETVTFEDVIDIAKGLSDNGDCANVEYMRGMCELIGDCFPVSDTELYIRAKDINKLICFNQKENQAPFGAIKAAISKMYRNEANSESTAVSIAGVVSKESLAEFIVDSFNRGWISKGNLGIDDDGKLI